MDQRTLSEIEESVRQVLAEDYYLKDYTRRAVRRAYASPDQFLATWTHAGQNKLIIEEPERRGVLFEPLTDEVGKDLDAFDLICHVAFDRPPLTRRERATRVRKRDYFARYGDQGRAVLDALLDKYAALYRIQ